MLVTLLVDNNLVTIAIASVMTALVGSVLPLGPAIVALDWLTRRVAAGLGAEPEIERPYLD